MNCTESRDRISKLIWDDTPLGTDGDLTAHMKGCSSCTLFHQNYLRGIEGFMAEKRIAPDPGLWSRIDGRILNEKDADALPHSPKENRPTGINKSTPDHALTTRPRNDRAVIIRLAWYTTVGAAAVLSGIWLGNNFTLDSYLDTDKQLYRQEISLQSDDLSGLNSGLIDYYTYEKQRNDE